MPYDFSNTQSMAHRPKTKRSCANSLTLSSPQMSSLSRFSFCHLQVCIVMFVTNTNTDVISVQVFFFAICKFALGIVTSDNLFFIIKSRHIWCWLLDFLYSITIVCIQLRFPAQEGLSELSDVPREGGKTKTSFAQHGGSGLDYFDISNFQMFSSNEYTLRSLIMCVCRAWQGKDVTQKVLQRLAHQYSPQSRTTPLTTFPRSLPR